MHSKICSKSNELVWRSIFTIALASQFVLLADTAFHIFNINSTSKWLQVIEMSYHTHLLRINIRWYAYQAQGKRSQNSQIFFTYQYFNFLSFILSTFILILVFSFHFNNISGSGTLQHLLHFQFYFSYSHFNLIICGSATLALTPLSHLSSFA